MTDKRSALVVVDMQNDFINGTLGTAEAVAIVDNVARKIRSWDGDLFFTKDTHDEGYLTSREGRRLPVSHCIRGTDGHALAPKIESARGGRGIILEKHSFGSLGLADVIRDGEYGYIEFVGLCTDICVISNVLIVKAAVPEADIVVDASCCAGVTPESHKNALSAMRACQIDVEND